MSVTNIGNGTITIKNGNIGIGTTNPTSALTIVGDTSFSGTISAAVLKTTTDNDVYMTFNTANAATGKFLNWLTKVSNEAKRSWWSSTNNTHVFSSVAAAAGYAGGVLLPDGRVVFVPYNTVTIGIFDPTTNIFSNSISIGGAASNRYYGGVLLPDGRVMFIPRGAGNIGLFNPSSNTFSTVLSGIGEYYSGVLLPNGRVLLAPFGASNLGIFDPATETMSYITENVPTLANGFGDKYTGGVLLPDGRVVFVPVAAPNIGIYTPAIDNSNLGTFSEILPSVPVTGSTGRYGGGVLLSDGRVLFVPYLATAILLFDPSTNTFSATIPATGYLGGVLLPDGRVLFVPGTSSAPNIGIFDPSTNLFSNVVVASGITGTVKYRGGVLLPDGRVILVPFQTTLIGIVSGFPSVPKERCLHPCFNKF
jgi:streptogramin lyase